MEPIASKPHAQQSVYRRFVAFIDPKDALRELVLIVSGILLALAIGNWNDANKQRQAEIQMLRELRSALQQDLADVEGNARICKENGHAKKMLLEAFEKNVPYQDSLLKHVGKTTSIVYLVTNRAAYETLKSKGLDLVFNDSLRIHITTLYEYTYKTIELSENTQIGYLRDEMQKHVAELLKIFNTYKSTQEAYKQLKTLTHFRDFLLYSQAYDVSTEKLYRELSPQVQRLIQEIEAEVKRLEG